MKKSRSTKIVLTITGLISACCAIFALSSLFADNNKEDPSAVERNELIQITANVIKITETEPIQATNTKIVLPTLKATSRFPTIAISPTKLNSRTPLPTNTNFVLPTSTPITRAQPIDTSVSVCNCNIDYDCKNFSTHYAAQTCFNYCGGSTSYNWSRLDADGDGQACESLP